MAGLFSDGAAVMMPPGERSRTIGGMHGAVPMEGGAPPSSYAVASVVNGEPGGTVRLVGVTFLRSIFIAPGLWLGAKIVGVDQYVMGWKLVGMTVGASSSISLGLLAWYFIKSKLAVGDTPPSVPSLEGTR